ncbi:hypothetical protein E4T44_00453 [Aureobasidium sp. EXF-8845]|nr:hypothetical protein E4T44_00453 [Aureobasidium sp. EXF-8845]KAI4858068.1 hypothetical protein E4T45_00421 [Aureobasidium sp. EXF-8846]
MSNFDDTDMPDAGDESDVSSVFDVDNPPSDQLRTYTAIHPPQLPAYTYLNGQDWTTRWIEDSWRYTARAYKDWDGSGFEVRQMRIDNFGDLEPRDPNDAGYWPPKYALGPPSQEKEWHTLIEKWGLPILEKAGFLNYYPAQNDRDMDPIGRLAGARNPCKDIDERIHPVLRQDMWHDLDDDDYQILEPALLLATAFLDDPATLTFLHAITNNDSMVEYHDSIHGKCRVARVPTALTDAEQTAVYSKVLAMRDWTSWQFRPTRDLVAVGALGITNFLETPNGKGVPAAHVDTAQSVISLSQTWLRLPQLSFQDCLHGTDEYGERLRTWLDKYGVQQDRRPRKLDATSAFDRATFSLANVIVHEFSHAYTGAYFRLPDKKAPLEPWIHGHRSNEMGLAFTDYLLGGCAHAMPRYDDSDLAYHKQVCDAVFGMYFEKQWDLWAQNSGAEQVITTTAANAHPSDQTYYPIPQKWFHNMHTEETWKHQVPRFGLAGVRFPRLEDWAVTARQKQ